MHARGAKNRARTILRCLYRTRVRDCKDGIEENITETMLTTGGIRCIGAPNVPALECVVIMILSKKRQTNHRDIEKCPVRNTYSRRDRVWEPGNQIKCQT